MDPHSRVRCATLIDKVRPTGHCDFVADFGILYPTEIFLSLIGLPVEDGPRFVDWVEAIFGGFHGHDSTAADVAAADVTAYFEAVVADREKSRRDPATDFVSYMLEAQIDDQPLPREDVVTTCLTIMLAGLDTTRSALGYIFHHLATHDADRTRIRDPQFADRAIEEFLRLYSLLIQDGRYVAEDIEFHGCPMKKGDMISLGIISANRDPRKFERPDDFFVERGVNPHVAFGLGPHRCLGMHLARRELSIGIEEWHARIPDYRLGEGTELMERGGQLTIQALPLEWDV
jgi:cytochrome P450